MSENPEKKSKEVKFRLIKIREISFSCNDFPVESDVQFNEENLIVNIGLQLKPNLEDDTFSVRLLAKYLLKKESDLILLLSFETETIFKILHLADHIIFSKNKNEFTTDNNLLLTFTSIAIGSLRGMLVAKTSGTLLNNFPLPLVNPADILKNSQKK